MKKVLINGLLLNQEFAGVQYSIENLLCAFSQVEKKDLYIEVLLSKGYKGNLTDNNSIKIKTINLNTSNRFARIFFENFILPKYFKKNGFNLYHSPAYVLPFFAKIPSIVTVHDLISLDFPALCQNETALYYNLFISKSIANATKVLTVSNTIKKDILKRFPYIDESKIEVIHHGIHKRFRRIKSLPLLAAIKAKYSLPSHFLLFVGNLEPKKNINRIIESFLVLKKDSAFQHKLVIVGKKGWKFGSIFDLLKKHDLQEEVLLLGYVDKEDLPAIYSLADIFLFPSLYEGFGIPVLEAMSCGCPVIVSNRGALPEISGNICPQVNPYSISEIVEKTNLLLHDKDQRNSQIEKGLQWSENFRWGTAAEKTLTLYHSTLGINQNINKI